MIMFLVDIDECEIGNHTCFENSTCVNAAGSFRCFCNRGLTGDGSKACYGMYCVLPITIIIGNKLCKSYDL